jgi:hypothetical protein
MLKEEYNEYKEKNWLKDFRYTWNGHNEALDRMARLMILKENYNG